MSTTVRVLLCDDHKIVREGLKMVLADDPCLQVVAEADTGPAVLDAVQTLQGPQFWRVFRLHADDYKRSETCILRVILLIVSIISTLIGVF